MERNKAVDISKGIGIILVLLGHSGLPNWIVNPIYFFHMPFFIAISAYFYKEKTGFRETLTKGGRIIISYLFYGFLFFLLNIFLFRNVTCQHFISLILAQPIDIWDISFFGVFWFIIALFVIKLIVSVVKVNTYSTLASIILFFLIPELLQKFQFISNIPFAFSQALFLLVFFMFGIVLQKINNINSRYIIIISILIFTFLTIYAFVNYNGLNQKIVNYHHLKVFSSALAIFVALSGICIIYSLSVLIAGSKTILIKVLSKIGEYSFTYYALHVLVFFILRKVFNLFGFHRIFATVFVITLSLTLIAIFIFIVNKYLGKFKLIRGVLLLK